MSADGRTAPVGEGLGGVDTSPPSRRRRHASVTIASVLAVALLAGASAAFAAWGTGEDNDRKSPTAMVAPDGVLDPASVSAGVAAEFHYAAGHLDAYRQLRCWCGCEAAFDHASLADCFVRPDGQWEAHGAGCGVCIASAILAREGLDAGTPITDIAAEIDGTFGRDPNFTKDPA